MRRRNLKVALVNTVLAAIILGLYFALSLSHRAQPASVSGFPIYHGNNRKCVAIECAVTWDAAALDEILAVLEERGVRITFAVSGEWVERSPAMLKKIAAQGHEIATMGYAPSKDGGVDFVLKDIQKSLDCIESVLARRPSRRFIIAAAVLPACPTARREGLGSQRCSALWILSAQRAARKTYLSAPRATLTAATSCLPSRRQHFQKLYRIFWTIYRERG